MRIEELFSRIVSCICNKKALIHRLYHQADVKCAYTVDGDDLHLWSYYDWEDLGEFKLNFHDSDNNYECETVGGGDLHIFYINDISIIFDPHPSPHIYRFTIRCEGINMIPSSEDSMEKDELELSMSIYEGYTNSRCYRNVCVDKIVLHDPVHSKDECLYDRNNRTNHEYSLNIKKAFFCSDNRIRVYKFNDKNWVWDPMDKVSPSLDYKYTTEIGPDNPQIGAIIWDEIKEAVIEEEHIVNKGLITLQSLKKGYGDIKIKKEHSDSTLTITNADLDEDNKITQSGIIK